MALICPACKRPVGAEDRICRYCGVPSRNFIEAVPAAPADDEPIRCPHCGSAQIQAIQKGFSVGRAIAGAALTGSPLGAAAGAIGAGKIRRACLKCGKEF